MDLGIFCTTLVATLISTLGGAWIIYYISTKEIRYKRKIARMLLRDFIFPITCYKKDHYGFNNCLYNPLTYKGYFYENCLWETLKIKEKSDEKIKIKISSILAQKALLEVFIISIMLYIISSPECFFKMEEIEEDNNTKGNFKKEAQDKLEKDLKNGIWDISLNTDTQYNINILNKYELIYNFKTGFSLLLFNKETDELEQADGKRIPIKQIS